jgi:hypothetical protein
MRNLLNRPLVTALLLTCTLLARPLPSRAQFTPNPNQAYPAARTQAAANAGPPAAANTGTNNTFRYNPFQVGSGGGSGGPGGYGYPGYGYGYGLSGPGTNPYYGYLAGAAEVTNANAQYQLTTQQARIVKEQSRQAQIETRRKTFDEMQYEQANTPTAEDLRDQERATNLRRSRNDPPSVEIWSGQVLNNLLADIQKTQATQGVWGPAIPLDPDTLRKINVTTGTTRGEVAMLKGGGPLDWPLALKKDLFDKERQKIDQLVPQAVRSTASGAANDKALDELLEATKALKKRVGEAGKGELSCNDYVKAMRYTNQLYEAVRILPEQGAANYLNGQWQARGNTVGDLVNDMTRNGLKFAPATDGGENAYTSLYHYILAYNSALGRMAPPVLSTSAQPRR